MSSSNTEQPRNEGGLWSALGPGILFAATSVGVSHLVQSTRAGAVFGLGLLLVVILAHLVKYPAFRFSTHYVGVTGRSLLYGYQRLSPIAPWVFVIAVTPLYILGVAALSMVTSGLMIAVFGLNIAAPVLSIVVLAAASAFVMLGHYHYLEVVNKWLVVFLAVITVISAIIILPQVPWSLYPATAPAITPATLIFIVALIAYMPSPVEVSVLHSLWSVAKQREHQEAGHKRRSVWDFNIGYIGTTFLAVCFVFMGAGVMHAAGIAPEAAAPDFASQLIGLYTEALGPLAGLLAGTAALITIITSLLTVVDGGPRSIVAALRSAAGAAPVPTERAVDKLPAYYACVLAIALMAIGIVNFLTASFSAYLDFAAGLSFSIGPVIATLNHLVLFGATVPADKRPPEYLRIWSLVGIVVMIATAVVYLWFRYVVGVG